MILGGWLVHIGMLHAGSFPAILYWFFFFGSHEIVGVGYSSSGWELAIDHLTSRGRSVICAWCRRHSGTLDIALESVWIAWTMICFTSRWIVLAIYFDAGWLDKLSRVTPVIKGILCSFHALSLICCVLVGCLNTLWKLVLCWLPTEPAAEHMIGGRLRGLCLSFGCLAAYDEMESVLGVLGSRSSVHLHR